MYRILTSANGLLTCRCSHCHSHTSVNRSPPIVIHASVANRWCERAKTSCTSQVFCFAHIVYLKAVLNFQVGLNEGNCSSTDRKYFVLLFTSHDTTVTRRHTLSLLCYAETDESFQWFPDVPWQSFLEIVLKVCLAVYLFSLLPVDLTKVMIGAHNTVLLV